MIKLHGTMKPPPTPAVRPMLAAKKTLDELEDLCYYVSMKYDGIRALTTPNGGQTRSGKPVQCVAIQEALGQMPAGLDGELMAGADPHVPFAITQSRCNTIDGRAEGMYYVVYDNYWNGASISVDNRIASLELVKMWARSPEGLANPITLVLAEQVRMTRAEVSYAYTRAIAEGYEGLCLRACGTPYRYGRVTPKQNNLIALKDWRDFEARLISVEPQHENTSPKDVDNLGYAARAQDKDQKLAKDMMGRMVFKAINGPFEGEYFNCGGGKGVDHQFRRDIWRNWPAQKNAIATLKYQPIGSQDKPRSPQFVRWRDPE